MPTALHSRLTRVLYEHFEFHDRIQEVRVAYSAPPIDSTPLEANRKQYRAAAQVEGQASMRGLFDGTISANGDFPMQQVGVLDTHITVGFEGIAIGKRCYSNHALQSNVSSETAAGGLAAVAVDAELNEAHPRGGKFLTDGVAILNSTTYAGVNDGAASTGGGLAVAHVIANAGAALQIKVQHSADGSVWADLVTLPAIAAGETKAVHALVSGTVNAHTRAIVTYQSGSGSTKSHITFTRG